MGSCLGFFRVGCFLLFIFFSSSFFVIIPEISYLNRHVTLCDTNDLLDQVVFAVHIKRIS